MKRTQHILYISFMVLSGLVILVWLFSLSLDYYALPMEERFFHPDHESLKPSGFIGHGLGIIGTLFMLIAVVSYMIRKRWTKIRRWGILKHWLEMHIFLATVGPMLVLFHTSFKFGGLVSISFWSMVAVFASGIIGRFIYIQIPRSLDGRELSLEEIQEGRTSLSKEAERVLQGDQEMLRSVLLKINETSSFDSQPFLLGAWYKRKADIQLVREIRQITKPAGISDVEKRKLLTTIKKELHVGRRMSRLLVMQKLFKYWHLAHLPFAILMIIILLVHVITAILLGYYWIF